MQNEDNVLVKEVLSFWFEELTPDKWWTKSDQLDADIQQRFSTLHQRAAQSELDAWRTTPEGSLAEVLILDQFSRNMFRDHARAFASDSLALALAQTAIAKGFDMQLPAVKRSFMYLPFMHSESLFIHEKAVALYAELGNEQNLEFELKHKAIIEKFGRYPHRNDILGRASTEEEKIFLTQPGSSF